MENATIIVTYVNILYYLYPNHIHHHRNSSSYHQCWHSHDHNHHYYHCIHQYLSCIMCYKIIVTMWICSVLTNTWVFVTVQFISSIITLTLVTTRYVIANIITTTIISNTFIDIWKMNKVFVQIIQICITVWCCYVPVQCIPSLVSVYPALQEQVYDPSVFSQTCSQLSVFRLHSLISIKQSKLY